jgi:hypothetical protein
MKRKGRANGFLARSSSVYSCRRWWLASFKFGNAFDDVDTTSGIRGRLSLMRREFFKIIFSVIRREKFEMDKRRGGRGVGEEKMSWPDDTCHSRKDVSPRTLTSILNVFYFVCAKGLVFSQRWHGFLKVATTSFTPGGWFTFRGWSDFYCNSLPMEWWLVSSRLCPPWHQLAMAIT